jgi:hypothetical protein
MRYQRLTPLDTAVSRMTKAAQSQSRENLVMTTHEWKRLVISGIRGGVREFGIQIVKMAANGESIDAVNRWLTLAMDIWNAMPDTLRRMELHQMEQNMLEYSSYIIPVGEKERDDPMQTKDITNGTMYNPYQNQTKINNKVKEVYL